MGESMKCKHCNKDCECEGIPMKWVSEKWNGDNGEVMYRNCKGQLVKLVGHTTEVIEELKKAMDEVIEE